MRSLKDLWNDIISKSSYMLNRRPNCRLFYVCTGKWTDDQNLTAVIKSGIEEIERTGLFQHVSIHPMGAVEIQKLYHETKNKLSATINFTNRITLPDINGVMESYLGLIPFLEYLKLIQDENGTMHNIFDDNVRDFQGNNPVNKRIRKSLEEKKFDLFCVLNNGVTIVSSSLTPAGNRFTLRDYQVVNGCQTSHVLHECRQFDGIDAVHVPVKIVITDNDDIKTDIILATNSQTEVKPEQLEALSLFQKRLELYYGAVKTPIRLYYERRSQQYNSVSGIKKTQIISIATQIKSFASMFLHSPHLVSGYYGTIVNRFKGQIFGENHKFAPYFVSAFCYYRVEQLFRSGFLDSSLRKARFHIMMLSKIVAMGENVEHLNSSKIEKQCESLLELLCNDQKVFTLFQISADIFTGSSVDMTKRQYKSESDTEILKEACKAYLIKYELTEPHVSN